MLYAELRPACDLGMHTLDLTCPALPACCGFKIQQLPIVEMPSCRNSLTSSCVACLELACDADDYGTPIHAVVADRKNALRELNSSSSSRPTGSTPWVPCIHAMKPFL